MKVIIKYNNNKEDEKIFETSKDGLAFFMKQLEDLKRIKTISLYVYNSDTTNYILKAEYIKKKDILKFY